MKKFFPAAVPEREATPEDVFFNRRRFMKSAVGLGALASNTVWCGPKPSEKDILKIDIERPDVFPTERNAKYGLPEIAAGRITDREVAATHNNFYEFLPNKGGPVYQFIDDFEVTPWQVKIDGECNNPMTLDLDGLFNFAHEERLYHFRCVETWAMNIPWSGFPLAALLKKADPKSSAKFVRFVSAEKPKQMPGMRETKSYYPWPYHEGLRLDEAMNELAMVVTGVYGKPLPKQHGAPVRIIVPWKYGYKSPKSVVHIELVREEPKIFWQIYPHEYGFLSNVNPFIPHPRWSQQRSYWLGTDREFFPTPIFNGYERYVADLYPDEPRTPQEPLRKGQIAR